MKVIQCYARTNDNNEETKNLVIQQDTKHHRQVQKKDVIILMGYFNAKSGTDNNGYDT